MSACEKCDNTGVVFSVSGACVRGDACACMNGCTRCLPSDRGFRLVMLRKRRDGSMESCEYPERTEERTALFREHWDEVLVPCSCHAARERARAVSFARIPAVFVRASLATYRMESRSQTTAVDILREQARRDPIGGVGLFGPAGVGKTHLLCALIKHAAMRGVGARYENAADLVQRAREMAGGDERGAKAELQARIADCRTVTILALDEIGAGNATDFDRATIEDIVSKRYDAGLRISFATNCQRERLEERTGERVASRLAEMARCTIISGPDARRMEAF